MELAAELKAVSDVTLTLSKAEAHRMVIGLLSFLDPQKPDTYFSVTPSAPKSEDEQDRQIKVFLERT